MRSIRKRGADTNQNIFYLVVAIIVLASAAFGLDMALKSYRRTEVQNLIAGLSNGVKEVHFQVDRLPVLSLESVLGLDVVSSGLISRDAAGRPYDVSIPHGGHAPEPRA